MAADKEEDPFEGMVDHTNDSQIKGSVMGDFGDQDEDKDTGDKDTGDKDTGDKDTDDDDDGDIFDGLDDGDDDDDDDDDGDDGDDDDGDDGDGDDGDDDDGDDGDDGDVEKKDEDRDEGEKKKRNKKPAQKRIAELTKHRRRAEAAVEVAKQENAALMTRLEKLEARLTEDKKPDKKDEDNTSLKDGEPDPEKYKYGELDPKYIADLTDFRMDQRFKKEKDETTAKQQKVEAERQAKEITVDYNDKIKLGKKAYKDFDKVVVKGAENGDYPMTPETSMMALRSPVGHHVVYKIANNLKLAKRIAKLSPQDQARAFGRLEAQFSSKKDASRNKKNKTPKTNPPPKKRSGGSGVSTRNTATESFADFEKRAMKELQKSEN